MTGIHSKQSFFLQQLKKLSIELILLVVIFIICLFLLFRVADLVFQDKNTSFDQQVFDLFQPYINSRLTQVMLIITFFGSPYFLLPANIILAGTFLFIDKYRWYSLKIAAISITSTGVMFLLKDLLQRQRPMVAVISRVHGYSFPSGHSFSSLVFFGMLSYVAWRTVKNRWLKWTLMIICFIFPLTIGFSRIYLKVHFASDVIAGFCLGIIWLILGRWLLVKTGKVENI